MQKVSLSTTDTHVNLEFYNPSPIKIRKCISAFNTSIPAGRQLIYLWSITTNTINSTFPTSSQKKAINTPLILYDIRKVDNIHSTPIYHYQNLVSNVL